MSFRRLGPAGLRVPFLSLGGWPTIGGSVIGDPVKGSLHSVLTAYFTLKRAIARQKIIKTAFENGINMFDNAEDYSKGKSEIEMQNSTFDALTSSFLRRFSGPRDGPNDKGLSRKHLVQHYRGAQECLQRLQLTYVDVIFAHRCDITVPMEEIVRAFNYVIEKGWAFYWGTSEWTAQQIEEAHHPYTKTTGLEPRPFPRFTLVFSLERYACATTARHSRAKFHAKYNDGIPPDSRFATEGMFAGMVDGTDGQEKIRKVRELTKIAESLGATPTACAIAWVAKNRNTSTVSLGVSSAKQLLENLKALEVLPKLTDDIVQQIEGILDNKPPNHGRPLLDTFGRVSN
ncbi:voltage-gated potassium channel beta-2 subunit [Mycena vulgaris]|nr:voltage-gated potassium channel beta-2 subunit [Mycena vulgaris]